MQATRSELDQIAVVEDDDEFRELMVSDLSSRGFAVVGMDSAEALYRYLSIRRCHIVVLDVGLPGEDGYSVARHLRQMSSVGIIMLTARGDAGDMARGFDTGADLYLIKPVDLDVLASAVTSLQRRLASTKAPAPSKKNGSWSLVASGWTLSPPHGEEIALAEAERAFLQPLFANPGQPVARETLINELTDKPWEFDPHRLEVLVHRLRTRVKTATGLTLPIRAVRGVGYLFTDGDGSQ
ncbi:response regulator transcription factor [Pseudoxanthomonas sp. UTMC 1351]|uniref:response regulator transcription factor n=1 Tax=Pseudoxanthomonas sp. UTMC 1351 TaxID=2695853 RepID=UPI0034CE0C96